MMLTIKDSPASSELSAKKVISALRFNTLHQRIILTLMDLSLAYSEMTASILTELLSSHKLARADIMLTELDTALSPKLPMLTSGKILCKLELKKLIINAILIIDLTVIFKLMISTLRRNLIVRKL